MKRCHLEGILMNMKRCHVEGILKGRIMPFLEGHKCKLQNHQD